jgi:glyoxylase-like metal-dependent hydrolase (beta-lactamase superfamily II)
MDTMKQCVFPVRLGFVLKISEEVSVDRFVYSYLLRGDDICVVDTGVVGSEGGLVDALAAWGKAPSDVAVVVNTHEHPDHVGGNAFWQRAAQPRFACHADAARWIEDLELQYQERPIHSFYALAGTESIQVADKLQDGDEVDLGGGVTLQVIHTPGHSPGSTALYCPQEGALITGDTIPPTGGLPLYDNVSELRESLKKLAALPDVEKMYLSHAPEPFVGEEVGRELQGGLDYLDRMDEIVVGVVRDLPEDATAEEITHEALLRSGMETPRVMPLTITSIMSHVE